MHIEHYTSSVLEENHYYPFGLTISGQAGGNTTGQPYKYNGVELERHFGLETYETFYRGLDPQIGRFNQIDPRYVYNISPYSAMANNPVLYSDPLGDTTQIYAKNGVLFGTINDGLQNQVHFMNFEHKGDAMDLGAGAKNQDAVAEAWRENSVAFLGENSAKSLKALGNKSANNSGDGFESGEELGFYGEVSKSKEILFKELSLPDGASGTPNSYPMESALYTYDKNGGNRSSLFIIGHTHANGWNRQLGNAPKKEFNRNMMLQSYATPSGSPGSIDYLRLGTNPARLISSPLGITIYSTQKFYDSKNSVKSYDWFKK